MVIFREFFFEQSENNVARRILRRMNNVIRNPNVRRLLSFLTIGRILDVVLFINNNHKVLTKHIMVSMKRLGLAGSCTFSIGLISYSIGFPAMLKSQVKSQVRLKKGDEIRGFWEKLPQPLDFNIYIFNVTNPTEITSGAKPIVQEVGPFHYDLYRDKEDLVDREEDDTVEYSLRQAWYFNPEKSGASENAEIYSFHPVMLAVILLTEAEKPSALGVVSKAIDSIFKKPDSMFIRTTVKELFFHGVPFDCSDVKDFAGSAVCGVLQEKSDIFIVESDLRYRYGYFSKANGTKMPSRIRVYRGIRNSQDVGRMYSLGNATKMDTWPGGPCNDFRGTDGTIFPPFLTKDSEVWAHFPDICRSIAAYYVEPGKVQGFKTLHYTADLGDPSKNKDLRCLCLEPEGCMPKNVYNAGPCLRVPIRISLPHLLNSDPHYYEMIEGLSPDPEKHQMTFDFDAMTGTPIRAYKKIQFNVLVRPLPKVKLMKKFPEALFPIFWIEDGLELGNVLIKPLKTAYTQILIAKIIMWLMILGGIGMMIVAAVRYYKENNTENPLNIVPNTEKKSNAIPQHKLPPISTIQGMLPPAVD